MTQNQKTRATRKTPVTGVGIVLLPGILLLALLLPAVAVAADSGAGFKVVVHAKNPVSSMTAKEVSKLFLKTTTTWENGVRVQPVDLPETSSVREAFSQSVHGRSVRAIDWWWRRKTFGGGPTPPGQLSTGEQVVQWVATQPGAVGYVSDDVRIDGYGVKILVITD